MATSEQERRRSWYCITRVHESQKMIREVEFMKIISVTACFGNSHLLMINQWICTPCEEEVPLSITLILWGPRMFLGPWRCFDMPDISTFFSCLKAINGLSLLALYPAHTGLHWHVSSMYARDCAFEKATLNETKLSHWYNVTRYMYLLLWY